MQLRTQKIYVVRDDMEPEEGPYWSAHVDLLIREARSLKEVPAPQLHGLSIVVVVLLFDKF